MSLITGIAVVVFILVAFLMVGAILLQEGKGGGLAALGGTRAETAFGASNPIRRMTVVLAILFVLLAGFIAYTLSPPGEKIAPGAAPTDSGAEKSGKVQEPPLEPGPTKGDKKKPGGEAGKAAEGKPDAAPKAGDDPKPDAAPKAGDDPKPDAGPEDD